MRISKNGKLGVIILVLLLIAGISAYSLMPIYKKINTNVVWDTNAESHEEQYLLNFINTKLMDDEYGIKTNYIDSKSEGDITKGNSVLSESQGLMLLYYVDKDRKGEFDEILSYVNNNMILNSGVISWRVENGEKSNTSATIDDLRIIKALLLAEDRWGDKSYRKLALKISKGIKKELNDNNLLADFNDGYNKSNKVTLCYLDLPTFKLLADVDGTYKKIYDSSLHLMDEGFISEEVPLYRKEYDRSTESFDELDADTLLNSIILLNRAEAGEDVSNSIKWLKKKYKEYNGIFSSYNTLTGEATSIVESTSIYSNLLQVANILNDNELYEICEYKLKGYQVIDESSEIFGAYGNTDTLEVHSFDNLNALLAWRKVK